MNSKEELRNEMLQLRANQKEPERKEKSKKIIETLSKIKEFKEAKNIAVYLSLPEEVHTIEFTEKLLHNYFVHVPFINEKKELELSRIENFDNLEIAEYGVLTPKNKKHSNKGLIDLIIVPGLVFDEKGNRIGYGKGFFDKLLSKLNKKTLKIGLCFDFQIKKEIPAFAHDQKMDLIISEKRIIKNNQ